MLTTADVSAVPIFQTLPAALLERLAHTSADLRLSPGEFAVSEGGERALFAVLSGALEVVKLYDGVERTLGWRRPGAIFGEVPLALASPFPGGYRAAEPSRVMRVGPEEYYHLAAASKEFAEKIGALARERLGGLQSISAEPHAPRVTLVGREDVAACQALRRFLTRNQISFEQLAPDSPDLAVRWPDARAAERQPLVRLADGEVLVGPQPRELANRLGLQTQPRRDRYDVAIVGAGPAGLAAAVYGASEGLSTIVIECEAPGGQAGTSSRIENYLGFPNGVSGDELSSRALQQARRLGAEILVTRCVERIDTAARQIVLDGDEMVNARTAILATGVSWRRLEAPGVDRLIGRGVFYGAARSDAPNVAGLDVCLIGAGNSAGQAALHLAAHARQVSMLVRSDTLEKTMSRYLIDQLRARSNIDVRLRSELRAAHGETRLTAIDVYDANAAAVRRQDCGGLFIFIGADAETRWLPPEIARDERGYILTGEEVRRAERWRFERDPFLLETSVPGVFACGDVRSGPVKRVAAAVGDGSMAIAFVHRHLASALER
ncbi:MAG TPA: FAD-dependent oxidoreductase [Caulobacteraceae bacterium]|nr:FAD-dependent oxidoreductase [Caulobacteraceae bacterium]